MEQAPLRADAERLAARLDGEDGLTAAALVAFLEGRLPLAACPKARLTPLAALVTLPDVDGGPVQVDADALEAERTDLARWLQDGWRPGTAEFDRVFAGWSLGPRVVQGWQVHGWSGSHPITGVASAAVGSALVAHRAALEEAARSGPRIGATCYRATLARSLTEDADPVALHDSASRALAANRARTLQVAREHGLQDWEAVRSHWLELPFFDASELVSFSSEWVERQREQMPQVVRSVPEADCRVEVGKDWLGSYDRDVFYAGTFAPGRTPRPLMVGISAHECWPGHHLQAHVLAASERLPRFRRTWDVRVFIEGWATYSEGVARDLGGLGPQGALIELQLAAWRLVRVQADTGMHAHGWSDDRVRELYRDFVMLPEEQLELELTRLRTQPGGLTLHHVGAEVLRELRAEAEAELGTAFDARAFHSVVLEGGPLPIPLLRREVRDWMAAQAGR